MYSTRFVDITEIFKSSKISDTKKNFAVLQTGECDGCSISAFKGSN